MRSRSLWASGVAAALAASVVMAFSPDADADARTRRRNRARWRIAPVEAPAEDRQAVLDGSLSFALESYPLVAAAQEGNVVYSPFSLSAALGMLLEGARGETLSEMERAMHVPLPPDRRGPAFQSVLADLAPEDPRAFRLSVANALWTARQLPLDPVFVGSLREHFGARATALDFAGDPKGAVGRINAWSRKRTAGRIPSVLQPGEVHDLTLCILTNAVYFKAAWAVPFAPELTDDRPFTLEDGSQVGVSTMVSDTGTFGYAEVDGARLLELAYAGGEASLLLVVPDRADGLREIEGSLSRETLLGWLDAVEEQEMVVLLPKFDFESVHDLKPALQSLGMQDVFVPFVADLSGAYGAPGEAFVEFVKQKAFIAANEKGTEAGAVTAIGVGVTSAPPTVAVDRPFLFLLRHERTGTVLFIGRVTNPAE